MTREKKMEILNWLMDVAEVGAKRFEFSDSDTISLRTWDGVYILANDELGEILKDMGMAVRYYGRDDDSYDGCEIYINGVRIYWLISKMPAKTEESDA